MKNVVIGLVIGLSVIGCAEEPTTAIDKIDEMIAINDVIIANQEIIGDIMDREEITLSRLDALEKQAVYDPNAPELKYLVELTDPNWIKENGISKESRVLFNVSVNRGIALKNQAILAEVAKRLIAMEDWLKSQHGLDELYVVVDPNDPNEVKE